jgi:FkbM family methyltransferase
MVPADSIVILGAGNLGRRVARAIRPPAFCDNNPSRQGTMIDGIPVISPKAAIEQYPEATFVVAIWNPSRTEGMTDRIAQLKSLGARNIIPFTALFPQHGDLLLPHFLWERPDYYGAHKEEIARARALLDAKGQEEFDRQMRLRMGDHCGQVIDPGIQYFPDDLFRLGEDEVFIDCGAYNGDTIADFQRASHDHFARIIAFEPDPVNFAALLSAVNGDQRISLQPYATGLRRETLRLSMDSTGSHISETGACVIEAVSLDDVLADTAPTYIKFDIEGSEPDALEGGRQTITRYRPKLAVCVYHAPDHLWSLPLQLHDLLPDSQLTLRTYNADGLDCVCYCIPGLT